MKKQDATAPQSNPSEHADNPMNMGMGKKVMGRGGPMEMMQKMMAQMSQGEGQAKMEKIMSMCMGMCSETMTSIRQTNALAVHVTPEFQHAFGEWLSQLEDKALALLAKGGMDTVGLSRSLKITEDSALYILHRLAVSGKITLAGKLKHQSTGVTPPRD